MSLDPLEFRHALGRFATGVCVITINPPGNAPMGMTVNSFASVSLDPALVLWSLQKNSDVYNEYATAKQFSVNILTQEQEALSNQYAKKGTHALAAGSYFQGRSGNIVLKHAMASFECDVDAVHEGGDHIIMVGRVSDLHSHPAERKPLLFFSGQYCQLK